MSKKVFALLISPLLVSLVNSSSVRLLLEVMLDTSCAFVFHALQGFFADITRFTDLFIVPLHIVFTLFVRWTLWYRSLQLFHNRFALLHETFFAFCTPLILRIISTAPYKLWCRAVPLWVYSIEERNLSPVVIGQVDCHWHDRLKLCHCFYSFGLVYVISNELVYLLLDMFR